MLKSQYLYLLESDITLYLFGLSGYLVGRANDCYLKSHSLTKLWPVKMMVSPDFGYLFIVILTLFD